MKSYLSTWAQQRVELLEGAARASAKAFAVTNHPIHLYDLAVASGLAGYPAQKVTLLRQFIATAQHWKPPAVSGFEREIDLQKALNDARLETSIME